MSSCVKVMVNAGSARRGSPKRGLESGARPKNREVYGSISAAKKTKLADLRETLTSGTTHHHDKTPSHRVVITEGKQQETRRGGIVLVSLRTLTVLLSVRELKINRHVKTCVTKFFDV